MQVVEDGKGKETDFSLEPPEKTPSCWRLDFKPEISVSDCDLQNLIIIKLYHFKPSLQKSVTEAIIVNTAMIFKYPLKIFINKKRMKVL